MKRLVLIILFALPLSAADLELGIRHIVSMPAGDSGDLDIEMSRGFAATAELFFTEHLSTQLAASFTNPEAILRPENAEPVDLGTLGLDVYSLTARYHFAPRARVSAYAGGGAALVSVGNLDDQFGDAIEVEFGNETVFLVEAGLRYRLLPQLFADAGLSYMRLGAEGEGRGDGVPPEVNVDPVTLSAGVAWRF